MLRRGDIGKMVAVDDGRYTAVPIVSSEHTSLSSTMLRFGHSKR
jgi:hypothetical protein